jgi:hypothetical protein
MRDCSELEGAPAVAAMLSQGNCLSEILLMKREKVDERIEPDMLGGRLGSEEGALSH